MRKIRQPPPTEGEDRLTPFLASLVAEDLSPKTVDGCRQVFRSLHLPHTPF